MDKEVLSSKSMDQNLIGERDIIMNAYLIMAECRLTHILSTVPP